MNVSIYQARLPADLYAALKERAYQERRSVNSLVVEAVAKLLGVDEKSPGTEVGKEVPQRGKTEVLQAV